MTNPPASVMPDDAADRKEDRAQRFFCWILRHWLALMLAVMLVFVTLPFLAPVAMQMGWTGLGRAIHIAYIPFCHQLPQRSFFFFGPALTYPLEAIAPVAGTADPIQLRFFYGSPDLGWKMAWSDRMVSFYFMTPVFGLLYAALRAAGRDVQPISWKLLVLALLPMAVDGLTHIVNDLFFGISAGGFRDTNAWLSALTGGAFPGFYAGDHLGTFNWWMRLGTGLLAAWGLAFYIFPHLDRQMTRERERACGHSS